MKRALVFLAITFGITYAYDFLVVYPIAEGIAAMCAWCTVLAIFLSYVTIRTGSTFAAAIGHGAVNGTTNGVTLFSLSGGNPFVGPLCTGIVGGLPLLVVAAAMLWNMRRREKAGTLHIPEAGLPTACAGAVARGARAPQWRSAFFPDGVYWARDTTGERRSEQ